MCVPQFPHVDNDDGLAVSSHNEIIRYRDSTLNTSFLKPTTVQVLVSPLSSSLIEFLHSARVRGLVTHWGSRFRAHGQLWGLSLGEDTEQSQQREQAHGGSIWRELGAPFQEFSHHRAARDVLGPPREGLSAREAQLRLGARECHRGPVAWAPSDRNEHKRQLPEAAGGPQKCCQCRV